MKDKVVEILILIMSEIQDNSNINEVDLDALKNKGYTQSEITAAFSWLYDNLHIQNGEIVFPANPRAGSRRHFHEAEKATLSTEGQGFLVQLTEIGLIDSRDLENIIERAMLSGYEKLSLADLRDIVTSVLFAKSLGEWGGSRSVLNSRDTIH